MASFSLQDAGIYVAGHDFSGNSNQVTLGAEVDELDSTTFGTGGYRARKGGLKTVSADVEGFWESATSAAPDPEIFPALGTADQAVTIGPTISTEATVAYLFQAGKFSYQMFGAVGELAPFSLGMLGTNGVGMARGRVMKARGDVPTGTGAVLGTAQQLGAIGASQFLYATFHIFTAGTTITFSISSDDNSGFSSSTSRATVGPITTAGGTWATRIAGPITDDWWRVTATNTGTFNLAVAYAIQ